MVRYPSTSPLYMALAVGLTAYCLVLLVSNHAPIPLLTAMGLFSLVLISIILVKLWRTLLRGSQGLKIYLCALCKAQLKEQDARCPGCGSSVYGEHTY